MYLSTMHHIPKHLHPPPDDIVSFFKDITNSNIITIFNREKKQNVKVIVSVSRAGVPFGPGWAKSFVLKGTFCKLYGRDKYAVGRGCTGSFQHHYHTLARHDVQTQTFTQYFANIQTL